MEDRLVPLLTRVILWWDRVLQIPHVKPILNGVGFMIGTSGAFWFLSRGMSAIALKIHSALDYSLAVLFAVGYNLILGVLFGAVMALAIFKRTQGTDDVLAYQAGGFVFVYLVLSANYADAQGVVDEYSIVGYVGGLIAYLGCCVRSSWLNARPLGVVYDGLGWAMAPGPQRYILAATVAQGMIFAARAVRRRLFFKSVKIGGKRHFVF